MADDIVHDIEDAVSKIKALLAEIEGQVGSELTADTKALVKDATATVAKFEKGGILNDMKAAGSLVETLAKLTDMIRALSAIVKGV